ncbi:MAG: ATP-dependent Clp protease ATP-binding subunit [Candidatus Paceibacterota bacterium]|jgi:ATP-dependent Clp protease ATP-binding subunit ClpC|nr:ATP-dependent Clp protease ATP-binding subunit [Candidatus Paceibacterota bacterium]
MDNTEKTSIEKLSVYPLLVLEQWFPHALRHVFFRRLILGMSFSFMLFAVLFFANLNIPAEQNPYSKTFLWFLSRIEGVFLLLFAFWSCIYLLESFYRAIYFHNRAYKIIKKQGRVLGAPYEMSSEVATIFYYTENGDIIKSFLKSSLGSEILVRCGMMEEEVNDFLVKREHILELSIGDMYDASVFDMEDFALFIFHNYPDFSDFLFKKGVGEKDFTGAVKWAVKVDEDKRFKERWWSRDHLKKIGSLGKDFTYGATFSLDKYSHDITIGGAAPSDRELHYDTEVKQVENALSKVKEANVLLVGEDGTGIMDIVYEFAYRIDAGDVPVHLQNKRILTVDTNLIVASAKEKGILEERLIRLLNEAARAGNIILVFDHFTSFVTGARTLGTDVIDIMNPYLSSPQIHIIALAPTEEYHRLLAPNGEVTTRFEIVSVKQPEGGRIVGLLEEGALALERRYGVFFTYGAVIEVLKSAENYITEGVMPNKATDLLMEVAPYMVQKQKALIEKKDVLEFVRIKTNIPVGEISTEEKSKLGNLEEELHKRIVGQNDAVKAISDAVRRSRAGVRDPKKPIGSFLFLGPTGVGKTETAKALAAVYFDSEDRMARLDMSEYSSEDAVGRLIGSFELGKPGTLSMLVKNFPYGVLLLDEFEKTSKDVQNLFLSILDEGYFSDMGGHQINVKNIIFIATSNAGSAMMYDSIQHGESLQSVKQLILDDVIKKGILKPELLNRFDGVILFNPLEKKDIIQVAKIMCENLRKRLRDEHSINLTVNQVLIDELVKEGLDPLFGGRPMARAVKDKIEKVIAEKLISGEIQTGMTVELEANDFVKK